MLGTLVDRVVWVKVVRDGGVHQVGGRGDGGSGEKRARARAQVTLRSRLRWAQVLSTEQRVRSKSNGQLDDQEGSKRVRVE